MKYLVSYNYSINNQMLGFGNTVATTNKAISEENLGNLKEAIEEDLKTNDIEKVNVVILNFIRIDEGSERK